MYYSTVLKPGEIRLFIPHIFEDGMIIAPDKQIRNSVQFR